jgi:hypothetical protein
MRDMLCAMVFVAVCISPSALVFDSCNASPKPEAQCRDMAINMDETWAFTCPHSLHRMDMPNPKVMVCRCVASPHPPTSAEIER